MFDDAETPFYSARPRIFVDGFEDPSLPANLLSLRVEAAESAPARCTARFVNWGQAEDEIGYLYFDLARLDFGRAFRVLSALDRELFRGRILALEALYPQDQPPEIRVIAEDGLAPLAALQRTRTFEDLSDQDAFELVAAEHGLVLDFNVDSAVSPVPQLAQVAQSDLAFLRQLARRNDWAFWMRLGELEVRERGSVAPESLTLDLGGNLRDFRGFADVRGQYAEVRVSGWDVRKKEPLQASARMPDLNEPLEGISGPGTVQTNFGARSLSEVHWRPRSQEHAKALALARFGERARRFVTGRGIADGDGRIRLGGQVNLQGLGDLFNGSYRVTAVRHTFDQQEGFRTAFTVERPWLSPVPRRTLAAGRAKENKKAPEPSDKGASTQETIVHQPPEDAPAQKDVVDDSHLKETRYA